MSAHDGRAVVNGGSRFVDITEPYKHRRCGLRAARMATRRVQRSFRLAVSRHGLVLASIHRAPWCGRPCTLIGIAASYSAVELRVLDEIAAGLRRSATIEDIELFDASRLVKWPHARWVLPPGIAPPTTPIVVHWEATGRCLVRGGGAAVEWLRTRYGGSPTGS